MLKSEQQNILYRIFTLVCGEPGKIPALDGLRACAILLVLARHAVQPIIAHSNSELNSFWVKLIHNFSTNGWLGVDLFFVLSGFLIGFHLLRSWHSGESSITFFSKYWLKRILRTFPLYYAVIALILLDLIPLYEYPRENIDIVLFNHLVFMQDYMGATILVPLWSLATEEKFYLICPFLIILAIRLPKILAALFFTGLACVPLILRINTITEFAPESYAAFFWTSRAPFHLALDGLLIGFIVSYLYYSGLFRGISQITLKRTFILTSGIVLVTLVYKDWLGSANWYAVAVLIFFMSLLFGLLVLTLIQAQGSWTRFLEGRVFRFVSKLSYSLYLCHMLVLPIAEKIAWIDLHGAPEWLQALVFVVLFLLLSTGLSLLLHFTVERPFLKIKDRIALSHRPTNKATAA